MGRRLLITYQTLLVLVLLALTVPLAIFTAAYDTQRLFIDRLGDTTHVAAVAEPALQSNRTGALRGYVVRYDELYDVAVAVVDIEGRVVVASRAGLRVDERRITERVGAALSGEHSSLSGVVWPWSREPLVVVEPVRRADEIIGAAVTISPTGGTRDETTQNWLVLAAAALLAMLLGGAAAVPLTRWMLRPVRELDDASHALTRGKLDSRVHADAGPPELRRLAASFNAMADSMCALIERQKAFVSYASHQLRNPLAALRIRVENLGTDPDHAATLDEVDRLTDICDGLLALARTETVRRPVTEVDAAVIGDERVVTWAPVAERAGITLRRTGAATAPTICPTGVLDQVLDALIDNALKFAGPGATVTVDVAQPTDTSRTHVHVTDTGPAVTVGDLTDAAEPFWRNPAHQNVDGSGLGLAIVATLLGAYDGTVVLTPVAPHGVRATVTLPAHAMATAAEPA